MTFKRVLEGATWRPKSRCGESRLHLPVDLPTAGEQCRGHGQPHTGVRPYSSNDAQPWTALRGHCLTGDPVQGQVPDG